MATQNDGPVQTFIAGGTVTQWALVVLGTTNVVTETTGVAGEDFRLLGVAQEGGTTGEEIPVRMLNCVASCKCLADLTDLAIGDLLYTAANGEVTDAITSGMVVGVARDASSAAGDLIEVLITRGYEAAGVT